MDELTSPETAGSLKNCLTMSDKDMSDGNVWVDWKLSAMVQMIRMIEIMEIHGFLQRPYSQFPVSHLTSLL
jgi:hypothetical protein